ncbi:MULTISPECIES: S26 family signal peptidase [unclassified Treponema]|uniref:S26 family signal peptidase n=1 Tax=unclassified Treponema TaxID=2638727 RepID=UPI0020A4B601|nr:MULTISPECIES: S26 family signal peptidase [unclassified Treponema]UTC67527.1 signal peptidase I [Treponema sp. OMZ 789]UTC70255.1 signal peptidase I [Treponema sp. OMZ 790]UTC72970.1 signal peptidase I [Treponema sp. OMZ 791]
MSVLFYSESVLSLLFSILLIVTNGSGLAAAALLLGSAFSLWTAFCTYSFFKKKTVRSMLIMRKSMEYVPYVFMACFIISRAVQSGQDRTIFDAILAFHWIILVIYNRVILFRLKDKRLSKYFPELPEIPKKKRSVISEVFDWADAILQAACIVLLFSVFVLQLYVIPSESMVQQFMVGDRVAGFKAASGPTFPLSSFRFPQIYNYKRGDVVIIRNPHYEDDPNNELKFFTSQLVQYLTLTMVNINKDESGRIKADPLVKRIVGVGGEKLMLVDGVLYIKKAGEKDFKAFDESAYAVWDLSKLPQSSLKYVKDVKMNTQDLNRLQSVEAWRARVNFDEAEKEALTLVKKMKEIKSKPDKVFSAKDFLNKAQYLVTQMARDNEAIASKILTTDGGLMWFENFLTSWKKSAEKNSFNLYEMRNARLNVIIKLSFGKLLVRNAELYKANVSEAAFSSDAERQAIINELGEYLYYLALSSQRNMDEFPKGEEEYIPENCYFMMGDNRFNSTDMRHEYQYHLEALNKDDPMSMMFVTNVAPRYIHSSRMLGTVNLILFPRARFGLVK